MNRVGRISLSLATLLGASMLLCPIADGAAQSLPGSNSADLVSARMRRSLPPGPPGVVPPLPTVKSPVAVFRELMAMTPGELRLALTNRSPESQRIIRAKLREYMAMDPDYREQRLQATEMRWYLQPLLMGAGTNRAAQLASIPPRSRTLVEDRLQEWDKLPAQDQKALLANKDTLSYLTEIQSLTTDQRRRIIQNLSPARRANLERGIDQWSRMPIDQRRLIVSRFNQFFDLTSKEKEKALRTLSGPERRQIEKTLQTFGKLPPEQRAACAHAVAKYTSLSLAERQQFLKNAERWKLLAPSERQAWRDLVNKLPPPMPRELPPMPHSHPPARPAAAIATNGN